MARIFFVTIKRVRTGARPGAFLLGAMAMLLWSCDHSGPEAAPDATANDNTPKVEYGTKIEFGLGGNSEPFKASGWSKAEAKFTWSEGTAAVLRVKVAPTEGTVALKMTLAALIKEPELPFQPVEVAVNDEKIADWEVGKTDVFTAAIPHNITKVGGVLTITFRTPKSTSPKALGLNEDPRILGICCLNFELSKG